MSVRPVLMAAAIVLLLPGCKKKPPATPTPPVSTSQTPPEEGVDAPAPSEDVTPEEAAPEEPTPASEPEEPAESKDASSARLRKQVNGILADVDSTDVTRNRAALERLKTLKAKHPDVPEILLNIGVLEQKLGNISGARAAYEETLAKDPTAGHAYLYLGALKEEKGDLTGAEVIYREGMERAPESVAVRIGLVSTLRKQGRYDEAIQEAQEALKVNATSPEIYNDVGLAYAAQEDFLLAKFMYRKGLALPEGEEKAYLHANLGWAYYLEGKLPEATFRLKKAVELDGEYVPALVFLARVYMEDRNYEDTVGLLERAAKREPENHGVQMNLGIAYRGVERYDDAKKAYERALALEPNNPAPHFNLGILLGDYLKDYEASIAAFDTYKSSGGPKGALADEYIESVQREARHVEKRKQREAAAKKREADRAEQKRLAAEETARQEKEAKRLKKEQEKAAKEAEQQTPPEDATPEHGAPESPSAEDGQPTPAEGDQPVEGSDNPWGEE